MEKPVDESADEADDESESESEPEPDHGNAAGSDDDDDDDDDEDDELDESEDEENKVNIDAFAPWMTDFLAGDVGEVRESSRLTGSACVLVDAEDGISSNMERILRQANQEVPSASRVLELNTKHPLIRSLVSLHAEGRTEEVEPLARLLLDDAMLMDGSMKETAAMGRRIQDLLQQVAERAVSSGT